MKISCRELLARKGIFSVFLAEHLQEQVAELITDDEEILNDETIRKIFEQTTMKISDVEVSRFVEIFIFDGCRFKL